MSTDRAWVAWGERDPYFAVITSPEFRADQLTDEAKKAFFASGVRHVEHVLARCRRVAGASFKPQRALDFGCGVGRIALPLAAEAAQVVGLDVAPGMLDEARRNAVAQGVTNVEFRLSDDQLSALDGRFDLVHSFIVFQHIDIDRGRALFARLVGLIEPGGAGALHVTYAKQAHADRFGQPPPAQEHLPVASAPRGWPRLWPARPGRAPAPAPAGAEPHGDPEMQMNAYALGELAYILQTAGVHEFQALFSDHGGELGVFLFFRMPPAARAGATLS